MPQIFRRVWERMGGRGDFITSTPVLPGVPMIGAYRGFSYRREAIQFAHELSQRFPQYPIWVRRFNEKKFEDEEDECYDLIFELKEKTRE